MAFRKISEQLGADYAYKLAADDEDVPQNIIDNLKTIWDEAAETVYNDDDLRKTRNVTRDAYADIFANAALKSFGYTDGEIAYNTPNGKMIEALLNNCYFFSAAKSHAQLRALTSGVIDPLTGQIRNWKDFKTFANTVSNEHIEHHLKAEYNMAINVAQMSAKWADIETTSDIYDQLEFDAVIDSQTTELCHSFHGKVFAVNDPIWNVIYPPNHWGCRSTVRKVRNRQLNDSAALDTSTVEGGFRSNMARNGVPWPPDSVYYKEMPNGWKDALGDPTFKAVERGIRKGVVMESGINMRGDNTVDRQKRLQAADALANERNELFFVMPELKNQLDFRYKYYYVDNPYPNRLPDLRNHQGYWDVASYDGTYSMDKMKNMVKKIGVQSDRIVIVLNENVDYDVLVANVKAHKYKYEKAKEIIVVYPDGMVRNLKQP